MPFITVSDYPLQAGCVNSSRGWEKGGGILDETRRVVDVDL